MFWKNIVVLYNYLHHTCFMNTAVHTVRNAARQLVREFRLLDGRGEYCGLPFSECHLITELNTLGEATASDLCERLVLEKSTMSRLVNKLVDRGLICAACCEDDRRARILCLTEKGKDLAGEVDRIATSQVESALSFVSPKEAEIVLRGLSRYASSLRCARLTDGYSIRRIAPEDDATVAKLIRKVMAEFDAVGENFSSADPEIDGMHDAYSTSGSAFFVIEKDEEILGCGGMGPLKGGGNDTCELRKMYFLPGLRGLGLGSKLLGRILDTARNAGYEQCYLETMGNMEGARRLYGNYGFEEHEEPLGDTGHSGCKQYMTLKL